MVNIEFREGVTETLDILKHMEEKYLDKIPSKFIEFLEENKSENYDPKFDHTKSLNEIELKDKTKSILATIYINYWCNEAEKEKYLEILNKNEIDYQNELKMMYNVDNLFKKNKEIIEEEVNPNKLPVVINEKQNIFIRLFKFIKKLIIGKN